MSVVRDDYGMCEVSYEKPQNIHKLDNEHWRKCVEYITTNEYIDTPERHANQRKQRENFGDYLCRACNERHSGEELLQKLEIVFVRETRLPDYESSAPERITLQESTCRQRFFHLPTDPNLSL